MPRPEILESFALFGETYPNWKVTEQTLSIWDLLMSDLPGQAVLDAAVQFVRASKFPPTVAEIRAIAKGPAGLSAEEAWLEVHEQIRKVGWCAVPTFSDAKIERAVSACGGWRSLCSLPTVEMSYARTHFIRSYGAFVGRQEDALEREAVEQIQNSKTAELEQIDRDELREIGEGAE